MGRFHTLQLEQAMYGGHCWFPELCLHAKGRPRSQQVTCLQAESMASARGNKMGLSLIV